MVWNISFETGMREIDEQNSSLVATVEAMTEYDSNRMKYERLEDFGKLAARYFEREQEIHGRCGYKDAERHKLAHEVYLLRVLRMKRRFVENGPTLENEIIFIRDVIESLRKHIMSHDKDFADWYAKLGNRANARKLNYCPKADRGSLESSPV
jgi:hemerythrin-like metal-binding protein